MPINKTAHFLVKGPKSKPVRTDVSKSTSVLMNWYDLLLGKKSYLKHSFFGLHCQVA